jgi:protein ImuB
MFAVIHLPRFALQAALRHEPELWPRPVALVDPALATPRVFELTDAASVAGIELGQTPTQALARCREVVIRHRSPKQEAAATQAMLQCAESFSPNLEATAPGLCTLDLRGLVSLKDADPPALAAWTARLRDSLARLNLQARIGLGPTPNVARHAARWTETIQIVGDAREFITTLPVVALAPSSDVEQILHKWGIRTVGELLALGQDALAERLGLEAFALFAAASDTSLRPLKLVRPEDRFEESFDFEQPVETLEPLLFLLRRFVDQLGRRLESTGFVAETLTLRLRLESGERMERPLRVPQPTRDSEVLFRMVRTHLETARTESAIVTVTLTAEPTRPQQKQFGLFEAALRDPQQFQETLARLSALLGAERVGTPILEDSHRPDVVKLVPPDFEGAPVALRGANALAATPIRRLRPPLAARVEGTAAPVSIQCALANGRLQMAVGPWRASGHWWEPAAWERDEWDVVTRDGKVLRLVRQADGWFVEGILD